VFALDLLPSWPLFSAFLVASFLLAVTPGPGVFYIVSRSLAQGRASGLASVAGVALGNFGNAIAASVGLAALFAVSSLAFSVVKYAGAAYLIYLGIQSLRSPAKVGAVSTSMDQPHVDVKKIFRDGFVVALLNPKTTIFFAAFLPQFIHPNASVATQSVLLGAIFVAIAAVTDSIYALMASQVKLLLLRSTNSKHIGRVGHYASGFAYIGLGLLTVFADRRTSK
jgi:threonine/homoserine/homoserine lactone efflux protein